MNACKASPIPAPEATQQVCHLCSQGPGSLPGGLMLCRLLFPLTRTWMVLLSGVADERMGSGEGCTRWVTQS